MHFPGAKRPPQNVVPEGIASASRTFKGRTGVGVDDFHPRWFAFLSQDSLQALADILNLARFERMASYKTRHFTSEKSEVSKNK